MTGGPPTGGGRGPTVVVARKWVDRRPQIDPLSGTVSTDPRSSGASDADDAALEWALRLAGDHGGSVVAVTVGPPETEAVLTPALAAGAQRAVRVAAPADAASGTVAAALGRLARLVGADAVVCGDASLDRGSGAVPALVAHHLGWPQALGLVSLTVASAPDTTSGGAGPDTSSGGAGPDTSSGGAGPDTNSGGAGPDTNSGGAGPDTMVLSAFRRLDGGRREALQVAAPFVVSVEGSSAQLRRAPLAGALAAARAAVEVVALGEVPAELAATAPPPARRQGPYRPRPHVVAPPPSDLDARHRVLALTGALVERTPPQLLVLAPEQAADRLLDALARWGELPTDVADRLHLGSHPGQEDPDRSGASPHPDAETGAGAAP